jgi:acetyl-CoA acetyltransferase
MARVEFAMGGSRRIGLATSKALLKTKGRDEIAPFTVKTRKGDTVVDSDEYIRHGATIEGMQKLRPAFDKEGTVPAAGCSTRCCSK